LRVGRREDLREVGTWVSGMLAKLFATEDHREGVASFLEKRAPVFHGR
jgi:enoyl-CoA hydratase/carnithine racemase